MIFLKLDQLSPTLQNHDFMILLLPITLLTITMSYPTYVLCPIFLGAVGCVHSATLRQEQDGRDHAHEEDSQGLYKIYHL